LLLTLRVSDEDFARLPGLLRHQRVDERTADALASDAGLGNFAARIIDVDVERSVSAA